MAKGKEALIAANRRIAESEARVNVLTERLGDALVRTRDAEQRVRNLEGIEGLLKVMEDKYEDAAARWNKSCRDARRRNRWSMEGLNEMIDVLIPDLNAYDHASQTFTDKWQFLVTRYPHIVQAVTGQPAKTFERIGSLGSDKKMSTDTAKKLQASRGVRTIVNGKEIADARAEFLEAIAAGFTEQEASEISAS